jgi:hypothetical protein
MKDHSGDGLTSCVVKTICFVETIHLFRKLMRPVSVCAATLGSTPTPAAASGKAPPGCGSAGCSTSTPSWTTEVLGGVSGAIFTLGVVPTPGLVAHAALGADGAASGVAASFTSVCAAPPGSRCFSRRLRWARSPRPEAAARDAADRERLAAQRRRAVPQRTAHGRGPLRRLRRRTAPSVAPDRPKRPRLPKSIRNEPSRQRRRAQVRLREVERRARVACDRTFRSHLGCGHPLCRGPGFGPTLARASRCARYAR